MHRTSCTFILQATSTSPFHQSNYSKIILICISKPPSHWTAASTSIKGWTASLLWSGVVFLWWQTPSLRFHQNLLQLLLLLVTMTTTQAVTMLFTITLDLQRVSRGIWSGVVFLHTFEAKGHQICLVTNMLLFQVWEDIKIWNFHLWVDYPFK